MDRYFPFNVVLTDLGRLELVTVVAATISAWFLLGVNDAPSRVGLCIYLLTSLGVIRVFTGFVRGNSREAYVAVCAALAALPNASEAEVQARGADQFLSALVRGWCPKPLSNEAPIAETYLNWALKNWDSKAHPEGTELERRLTWRERQLIQRWMIRRHWATRSAS